MPTAKNEGRLLVAENGAKGSLPLKGSPRVFLLAKGSAASTPKGWKGSGGGLQGSLDMLTGVVLPGRERVEWEDKAEEFLKLQE